MSSQSSASQAQGSNATAKSGGYPKRQINDLPVQGGTNPTGSPQANPKGRSPANSNGSPLVVSQAPKLTLPVDKAAAKIQAQVRRKQDADGAQYAQVCRALNQLELRAESDQLLNNKKFARAAAILANDGLGEIPWDQTVPVVSPKSRTSSGVSNRFCMEVEHSPTIQFVRSKQGHVSVDRACVKKIMKHFKQPGASPLDYDCVKQLVEHSTKLLRTSIRCAVNDITTPEPPGQCIVVGDTHGQSNDVFWLFFKYGEPTSNNMYIFNGDMVDRGPSSCDILIVLLLFKLLEPNSVHFYRGNHEDRSMNEYYGFLDECVDKWGLTEGVALFDLFNVLFEHLPFFTLIDRNVFVIHGGLWRRYYGIPQLRRIHFRRPIPEPGPGPETLLFDSVWADPQAARGIGTNARGPNIITWGPDITEHFVKTNGVRLLVRSHEVPEAGRGYQWHHSRQCLTIFSASNYCQQIGNLGAVLILARGEKDRIDEHWAPPLEQLQEMEADAGNALARIKAQAGTLTAQRKMRKEYSHKMEVELIRRIQELFVKHKAELFEHWTLVDASPRGVFRISAADWREGCASVIDENLPWKRLQDVLGVVDADDTVHYVKFLTRYRVAYEATYGISPSGWEGAVWSKIMETLLLADLPLREALAALDPTGVGMVAPIEFGRLLESCGVGVSSTQARALLRTFALHSDKQGMLDEDGGLQVSIWEMLARLQISLPIAPSSTAHDPKLADYAVSKMRSVAAAVLDDAKKRLAGNDADTDEWPAARLLAVWFEDADTSGKGFLEYEVFVESLMKLDRALQRGGCPADHASLMRLAKYCDVVGNGHINYFELLNGLTWEDSLGPEFEQDLLETINASIYFNMTLIRRSVQRFDPDLTGLIFGKDLVAALKAVHTVITAENSTRSQSADSGSITKFQIQIIAQNLTRDDDGRIDYERFLDSFHVVDTHALN